MFISTEAGLGISANTFLEGFTNTAMNRQFSNYELSASVIGNHPGDYTCQVTVLRYDGTGVEPEVLVYPETPGPLQTITVRGELYSEQLYMGTLPCSLYMCGVYSSLFQL